MLSYQHHYHAGNHADVLKHWTLLYCVAYMQQKETGFDYIDTHAGAGLYALDSALARKTLEAQTGIVRLLNQPQALQLLPEFCAFMQHYVGQRQYPGSPECVRAKLRPVDRAWLFELHPATFRELSRMANRKRIFVRDADGLAEIAALLPTPTKRALILIDPSYEVKSDYISVVDACTNALKKLPQATCLIWYPIVHQARVHSLCERLRKSDCKDVLQLELAVAETTEAAGGMNASGLLVVNPPWRLAEDAATVLPPLSALLAEDGQSRATVKKW